MADPVLLLGARRGALRALRDRGFAVRWADPAPDRFDAAAEEALPLALGPEGVEGAAERILRWLGEVRPRAVLAGGERWVELAARVREALGAPGLDRETARRCTDKLEMKRTFEAAGLPCARWRAVSPETNPEELVAELGLPLVLERARSSGSRGLETVNEVDALLRSLPGHELAEGWVEGVEMSFELFVHAGRVVFCNPTEYLVPRHANVVPAQLPQHEHASLRSLAESAVRATGADRGVFHVEVFRTAAGPIVGEVAARPPGGRLMHLISRAYGIDAWRRWAAAELDEPPPTPPRARRTAGTWILHPGPGRVLGIDGVEAAARVPGVRRVRLRVRPGDVIPPRIGAGQDVGYIDAEGASRDEVVRALRTAAETIVFRLAPA